MPGFPAQEFSSVAVLTVSLHGFPHTQIVSEKFLLFHLLKSKNFCRTLSVLLFHFIDFATIQLLSPLNILIEYPGQTKTKNVLAQKAVQILLSLLEDWNS